MDQRTHAWLAVRAVALLEEANECPGLVKLLKPFVKTAAIGAWIPDLRDAKLGSGRTQNHVLKIKPYRGPQQERFITEKQELLKKLGPHRLLSRLLKEDQTLSPSWWGRPYKGDPPPGLHLPNRAMSVSISLIDLLTLGNKKIHGFLSRRISFADKLSRDERTRPEQAALFFFMLSHFIADSLMPCHCDARDLADYDKGLHKELEAHWSRKVGPEFSKKRLLSASGRPDRVLDSARAVDERFEIRFAGEVPSLVSKDLWKEVIYICRGAFALSCIIAPPSRYPFNKKKRAPFNKVLAGKELLARVDRTVMHDSVLNIAMAWKEVWEKF